MAKDFAQLSDSLKARIADIAKSMGGGSVKVGFMAGALYPDGTPVAAVAAKNEYGDPSENRPPRPFFRRMIEAEQSTWAGKLVKAAQFTGGDAVKSLGLLGEDIAGALQKSINDFQDPALADSTIARKGFAKPLIDTAHMINSVTYVVEES